LEIHLATELDGEEVLNAVNSADEVFLDGRSNLIVSIKGNDLGSRGCLIF
jgi:hypothetical protein